jgi:hypothetical protein
MKLPFPVIGLMVAASVLLDLCFWTAAKQARWPAMNTVVFFALSFSQISLVAAWAAIGRTSIYIRVMVAALIITLLGSAIAEIPSGPEKATAFWVITQTLCTMLPLACLRFAGFSLRCLRTNPGASKRLKPWQLSIKDLLQITTAAAVLVSIAILAFPKNLDFDGFWLLIICVAAVFSISTPAFVFSLLTTGSMKIRLGAASLFAFVNSFIPSLLIGRGTQPAEFLTMYFLTQAWVIATLVCIRLAGYRFSRFRGNGSQSDLNIERFGAAPSSIEQHVHDT